MESIASYWSAVGEGARENSSTKMFNSKRLVKVGFTLKI
jgi:hypothetical protein